MNIHCKKILQLVVLFGLTPATYAHQKKSRFEKTVSAILCCLNPVYAGMKIKRAFKENFYTVEKKKLYRSAQLSSESLKRHIKKYGIKTVINLRGTNPQESWWQQEKSVCKKAQVKHFDISMSARVLTRKKHLFELLDLYDTAPQPILVHCFSGADRTGEAAALWRLEKQKFSKRKASHQLSPLYGHFKSKYPAKDFLIGIWGGRKWLKNTYDPDNYSKFK